jgi:predicted RNA-binding protein with EMAP domain
MDLENASREELIQEIKEMLEYMDDVIVFWGGKKDFKNTFAQVAENAEGEYTSEEARSAKIIVENQDAFDTFLELVRESFDRGGINYMLSEKVSSIMEEVGRRYSKN